MQCRYPCVLIEMLLFLSQDGSHCMCSTQRLRHLKMLFQSFLIRTGISVFCIFWGIWKQMLDIIMSKTRRKEKGTEQLQPAVQHNVRRSLKPGSWSTCGIWPWCWSDHVWRLQLGTTGCSKTLPSSISGMLTNCFILCLELCLRLLVWMNRNVKKLEHSPAHFWLSIDQELKQTEVWPISWLLYKWCDRFGLTQSYSWFKLKQNAERSVTTIDIFAGNCRREICGILDCRKLSFNSHIVDWIYYLFFFF